MKKYLFSIALLFSSLCCYSQTYCPEIGFLYDASGNRYYRAFLPTNPCEQNNNHSPKKKENTTIKIYPNPAITTVSIDVVRDSACANPTLVYMYDINGQPVFSTTTSAENM